MSDIKHTPGPWYPGHLGSDSTCQCANVCDEGHAGGICTIHVDNGLKVGEGGNDAPAKAEAVANMHLIAAAPDLLAALKKMLPEANRIDQHLRPTFETCEEARAAIAKAEVCSSCSTF